MTAVRVRRGKVGARGKRGLVFSINPSIAQDLNIGVGGELSVYRAAIGGVQVVVLANSDAPMLSDDNSTQAREFAEYVAAHQKQAEIPA